MRFTLQFGKDLISSKSWSKCASGQIVSRIRFFHSRKCSIGVFSSSEISVLFPLSTVLGEHTVGDQISRRRCWIFSGHLQCTANTIFTSGFSETIRWGLNLQVYE